MTLPGCTKMAISQLLLGVASSNLVGRHSQGAFVIYFRYFAKSNFSLFYILKSQKKLAANFEISFHISY